MKKLVLVLLALSLVISLPTFSCADELQAPFTKVKEYVEASGADIGYGMKALVFRNAMATEGAEIADNVYFLTADNGNVGIAVGRDYDNISVIVVYHAKGKMYLGITAEGGSKISAERATEFAFGIFRILVAKGLL